MNVSITESAAPVLLIAGGGDFPRMLQTAGALADAFPDGQTGTREGQGHNVDPAVLALALVEFFEIRRAPRRDT
jgi:hypothetical protein